MNKLAQKHLQKIRRSFHDGFLDVLCKKCGRSFATNLRYPELYCLQCSLGKTKAEDVPVFFQNGGIFLANVGRPIGWYQNKEYSIFYSNLEEVLEQLKSKLDEHEQRKLVALIGQQLATETHLKHDIKNDPRTNPLALYSSQTCVSEEIKVHQQGERMKISADIMSKILNMPPQTLQEEKDRWEKIVGQNVALMEFLNECVSKHQICLVVMIDLLAGFELEDDFGRHFTLKKKQKLTNTEVSAVTNGAS